MIVSVTQYANYLGASQFSNATYEIVKCNIFGIKVNQMDHELESNSMLVAHGNQVIKRTQSYE